LAQQPSGRCDGLLGADRGGFPTHHVSVISEETAEFPIRAPQADLCHVVARDSPPMRICASLRQPTYGHDVPLAIARPLPDLGVRYPSSWTIPETDMRRIVAAPRGEK
jgi:hypothetical protein